MSIIIDSEFKSLIPPLSADEYSQLEENCVREGIRDALVVWERPDGANVLIDGHNRFQISARHAGLPFEIKKMKFDSREDVLLWIISNQLGKRNLQPIDMISLKGKREEIIAEQANKGGRPKKEEPPKKSWEDKAEKRKAARQNETAYKVAKEIGISEDTYRKGKKILQEAPPEIVDKVRSGDLSINQAYLMTRPVQPKTPRQAAKEFIEETQQRHEDFREKKADNIISMADARQDETDRRIIAKDLYSRCLRIGKPVDDLFIDMRESMVDLHGMAGELTDDELRHVQGVFRDIIAKVTKISMEVIK